MEITTELVNHLQDLSRIEFDEKQKENFKKEFQNIVNQCEALNLVDTTGVETQLENLQAPKELDADEPKQGLQKSEVLQNAPDAMGASIAVPRMVD